MIKPASLRPGTGSVYQGRRVSAKYYLFLVCAHSLHTAYERGPAPHGFLTAIRGAGVGMGWSKEGPGREKAALVPRIPSPYLKR